MCSLLICYNLIWSVAIQSAGNCAVCWQVCAFRVVACREVLAWIVCWVRVCKFRHVGGNSRRCGWVVWRAWILSLLHEYALLHSMWQRVCVSKLCMSILCEFVTRTHMRTHASARVRLALSSTHTHTHAHSTHTHTHRGISVSDAQMNRVTRLLDSSTVRMLYMTCVCVFGWGEGLSNWWKCRWIGMPMKRQADK